VLRQVGDDITVVRSRLERVLEDADREESQWQVATVEAGAVEGFSPSDSRYLAVERPGKQAAKILDELGFSNAVAKTSDSPINVSRVVGTLQQSLEAGIWGTPPLETSSGRRRSRRTASSARSSGSAPNATSSLPASSRIPISPIQVHMMEVSASADAPMEEVGEDAAEDAAEAQEEDPSPSADLIATTSTPIHDETLASPAALPATVEPLASDVHPDASLPDAD